MYSGLPRSVTWLPLDTARAPSEVPAASAVGAPGRARGCACRARSVSRCAPPRQIPDRLAGQPGQPLAPQAEDLTPRGPRRDHQDRLAGGCRYPDARAKDCFPYADRHLAVDAVALALEKWMLLNPRADDQVAARAAERSRAPLAGHA